MARPCRGGQDESGSEPRRLAPVMAAICVFCASSRQLEPHWLRLAREVGAALASRGHRLVSGGVCVGMMAALAEGARSGRAHTTGVLPRARRYRVVAYMAA